MASNLVRLLRTIDIRSIDENRYNNRELNRRFISLNVRSVDAPNHSYDIEGHLRARGEQI